MPGGPMRVIVLIEIEGVIRKVLEHLGMEDVARKPSPRANAPLFIPDSHLFVNNYVIAPDYPTIAHIYQPTRRFQIG